MFNFFPFPRTSKFVTGVGNDHAKGRFSRKDAKARRKAFETRQRFASLRLCGKNILERQAGQIGRSNKTATPHIPQRNTKR
jgi:hypothetical protein